MKILDTYALIAFYENESGADTVRAMLLKAVEGNMELVMSVINLGEVWYILARSSSSEIADRCIQEIRGMAIEIVDADWSLTRQAAIYKSKGRMSYADCFAAALAKVRGGEVVTGDKEFKILENEVEIAWLT